MGIGQRVKALRVASGLSQTALAKSIGLTQGALSQIETGSVVTIRGETLVRLAGALGANAQWIQSGKGSPVAATVDTVDESEAIAIFRALKEPNRAAWLATGRALLDSQPGNGTSSPFVAGSRRSKASS